MNRSLAFLAFVPALIAQSPVDYAAVRAESQAAFTAVVEQRKAAEKAGIAKEAFKADFDKALAPLRAKRATATGELKEALVLAEVFFVNSQKAALAPETQAALAKIAPESGAWRYAPAQLPTLEKLLPAGFLAVLEQKGPGDVRAALIARPLGNLLKEGKTEEAKTLVARLQKEFPAAPATDQAVTHLNMVLNTTIGAMAPAFEIPDMDKPGEKLTNASFKGKYLLIDFWGTWCGWCVKELPNTHKVYADFKPKGLEILSLAADEKAEVVQAFRQKSGHVMPWKHAVVGKVGNQHRVVKDFGVTMYPSFFLVGPDGKIVAKGGDLREAKLAETLSKFMGK